MAQTEKKRVYVLAHELGVETKELLEYCRELGFEAKNQLASLDAAQCEQLKARIKQGPKSGGPAAAVASPARPAVPVTQNLADLTRVRNLGPGRSPRKGEEIPPAEVAPAAPAPAAERVPAAPPPPPAPEPVAPPPPAPVAAPAPKAPPAPPPPSAPVAPPSPPPATPVAAPKPAPEAAPVVTPRAPVPAPVAPIAAPPAVATVAPPTPPPTPPPPTRAPVEQGRPPTIAAARVPSLSGSKPAVPPPAARTPQPAPDDKRPAPGPRPGDSGTTGMPGIVRRSPRAIRAGGPGEFGTAARPTPPPSLRDKAAAAGKVDAKPKEPAAQKPVARLTTDEQQRKARQARDVTTLNKALLSTGAITETKPVAPVEEEDDLERKRAGGVIGRADRHAQRKQRLEKRKTAVVITDGRVEEIEDNRPIRGGRKHIKPKKLPGTVAPKGPTIIQVPITVRDLSAALGEKLGKLLIKVLELGLPKTTNVNSMLDGETAEMIALEMGKEVEIRRAADVEDKLKAGAGAEDNPEEMVERAPVVTIMGHVDHGKTSLLDRIRSSDVAGDEVGGITQVIRAWRVEHDGRPITFLDTPGHQAFTKMRARGAQVTDIAVIVVAADDGVMPQTEEAISHAKAAGVQLVIAINKVDLPNSNVLKTKQQLYSLDVLPDDMGGDTPFVETSAATGRGIDDLLEAILVAAELRELKSNPNKPAHGTCLEAHKEGDEGVFATVLVQHGTLRKGDVVICGASFGRVRAMYNDHNQLIDEAGPSVPVRITGLNEVPDASDSFHVVADLSAAREIAEKRHEKMLDAALIRRMPVNVDTFGQRKIDELKIILKADFRGSIEAIRAELEKLKHDEVRVRILHTGIGGITESDVELALTSPQDTMILGFNAVPDDAALALADSRGVKVREYNIIYELTNDVKAALEGRLKPREEIIHLGRALIRETFKISKVGTVAGCYVTSGVIERSSKIRVIREGVVVYPPADKTIGLESLKHFKDDVREVKQGYECGLKINGYDDIKVGDVIEAYRIEQVQRTL